MHESFLSPSRSPFFWGVSTSGYQVEGGYNGESEPLNNWVGVERSGAVQTSGASADFWNQAEADFKQCRALGLNSFRLSIEWSRVQPGYIWNSWDDSTPLQPPPFDTVALDRYAEIMANCRREGLEPIVTLHHFVHPAWLGLDPWLESEIISHFLRYVEKVVTYLLKVIPECYQVAPPRYWITVNEPNMLAFNHYAWRFFPSGETRGIGPSSRCLAHLLQAHAQAYLKIHEIYEEQGFLRPLVGFNNYSSDLYWGDQAWVDLFFVGKKGKGRNRFLQDLQAEEKEFEAEFLQAELLPKIHLRYWIGQAMKFLHRPIGSQMLAEPAWDPLLELIRSHDAPLLDYIPFDYYDPFVSHIIRWPHLKDFELRHRTWNDWVMESITSKWWDWRAIPEGMIFFARRMARHGLPILIAENGMAYQFDATSQSHRRRDGLRRKEFLKDHVQAVTKIREEGIPLLGYFYWSWCDNFEWGSFAPRFGLRGIDFQSKTRERLETNGLGENAGEVYSRAIQISEFQLQQKSRKNEA